MNTDGLHTILIIDDEQSTLDLIQSILLKAGFNVLKASTGEEAFECLENNRINLILLDIMMPDMDGLQLCVSLKSRPESENIPIIFLTALSDQENIVNSFAAGAVDYITKPFEVGELLARINVYIRLQETSKELRIRKGSIQLCSGCSSVRDEKRWMNINEYLARYSGAAVERALCPACDDEFENTESEEVLSAKQVAQPEASKILIVDDHPENIKILTKILTKKKYDVHTAQGGREALRYLQDNKPDLILLDIMMPDMDGYQVCTEIKSTPHTKDIPIIFLTALASTASIVKGLETGGSDFITKPFHVNEVIARVGAQIDFKNLHDMLNRQKSSITVCPQCSSIKLFQEIWLSFEKMYSTFGPSILTYTICPQCMDRKYGRN